MNDNIWDQVLSRIETKINRHSFYTWFKPTVFVSDTKDTVNVRVPNSLFREWLTKHYSGVVAEALKEVDRGGASVVFTVGVDSQNNIEQNVLAEPPEESSRATPHNTQPGGLNARYSFNTFIVGSSNQFAHAACRAVAEAPSRSYNPLFIYGGVGLGKTHLMHAIGQYVLQHNP